MIEFVDTHAHLGDAQFAVDRAEVLSRALEAGVTRLVEIADAPSEWEEAVALSRARPAMVRCALGLHPYYADQFRPAFLDELGRKARLPEVVAVGEIGLDYVKAEVSAAVQREAFKAILAACKDWNKPVVIHCRGAYADLNAVISSLFPAPPIGRRFWGVVHCFSGTPDDAVFLAGSGFALGADGPVTYPKNEALRDAFKRVGPDVAVLETDSPYLPPQSSRGKRNEPRAIPEIATKLAEVYGLPLEEVALRTTSSARSLFGLA